MANVSEQQVQQLQSMLLDYHSFHERQFGPMAGCQEEVCLEAKMGIIYLAGRGAAGNAQDSDPTAFNLK